MQVTINGEAQDLPDGLTVRDLLTRLQHDPRYLAVEINRQVIPRARHAEAVICAGDTIEIVTLVGGG